MSTNLENLTKRIEQLSARKSQLVALENRSLRKIKTRQAIIIGAWVLQNRPRWADEIKGEITRRQDLAAFGIIEVPLPAGFRNARGGVPGPALPDFTALDIDLS